MPARLHSISSCPICGTGSALPLGLPGRESGRDRGFRAMRRRYGRLAAAVCCVGAIAVMATLLLSGQGAGADEGDHPGSGHTGAHGRPSGHGHGSTHSGGSASPSASRSASASVAARPASTAGSPTPMHSAQPTAQPSTRPESNSAPAPAPSAHTTITLPGVQSMPAASHPVGHAAGQPARMVEVAAAPATQARDSVTLAATISVLLVALAVVLLTYGYRPSQQRGRHRSAVPPA
jgi:hypothetical protein